MTTTIAKVVCSECRHENEPERVYCHDCGSRLDRSAVVVEKEPVEDAQKRVKKMFDPHRARMRALFFKVSKMALTACALAAVLLMILPPDVPPAIKGTMLVSQIRFDLEGATTRHQPPELRYSEDQVNEFLAYALKIKQKDLNLPFLDFKRAIVAFGEGTCTLTVERSLSGYYSLYTSCTYAPDLNEGKITAPTRAASIGRLPVHPLVGQYMSLLFSDLRAALDRDAKLVSKLKAIEFHDKSVVLSAQ
jgi:hypothetical protein